MAVYGSADDNFDNGYGVESRLGAPCRSRPYRLMKGPTQ